MAPNPLDDRFGSGATDGQGRKAAPLDLGERRRTVRTVLRDGAWVRANLMNNEAVIRRISANFVPVAVNIYRMRGEDPASRFFQSVQKQKYSYQGVWIVDPEGKVTLMGLGEKNLEVRIKKFIDDIDRTVETFGPMKPRSVKWQDPQPWRGVGVQPDGKVTLALYVRHCSAREWETFTPPKSLPGIDSITFDAEEWATFTPAKVQVGAAWNIPNDVVRKFQPRC